MNRRDTILVSVLVNMALLVVLFVVAIKPSTPVEIAKVSLHQEKKPEKVVFEDKASLDQVDNLLSKFVAQEVKAEAEIQPKVVPKVVEAQSTPVNTKEMIVKQGDSLEKIAKSCRTTVSEIMKLNHLSDSKLHIGQILYVPKIDEMVASETKQSSHSAPSVKGDAKYYVVKHGDNPWTIAIKNGIKVDELLKLNGLDENKAKRLKPGDKLRIQ